ncbi:MAG: hypothetical protein RSA95_00390 [Citrobacter sp.]|uniref:hypothetical protein n=1 Tax=Citrobacter sp. TaxID=1896336 RepID=UPI002FC757E7
MSEKEKYETVLIYSPDWTHGVALKNLFISGDDGAHYILRTDTSAAGVFGSDGFFPDLIILDMSPRDSVASIIFLRRQYPDVKLIFTRQYFLYSDRMVAEYFGGIWLKEYDALMAGYPDTGVMEHITSPLFSGPQPPVRILSDTVTIQVVLGSLEQWMRRRLAGVISSPRTREVSLDWLIRGVSLRETAQVLRRSEKVMYHYRWRMMQALGICHYSRDFIPSLTVAAGPTGWGGSVARFVK